MTEAGRAIQTRRRSPRPCATRRSAARKVKRGQTIALDPDDGLVAVDSDREKAVLAGDGTRSSPGYELVTLFYGDGADLAEAEAMARRIGGVAAGRRGRGPATAASPSTGT